MVSAPTDEAGRFTLALYGTDPTTSQPIEDITIEFGDAENPTVLERERDPELVDDQLPWNDHELTAQISAAIHQLVEVPHTGWVPLRLSIGNGASWAVDGAIEGVDGPVNLRFADDSLHTLPFPADAPEPPEPLDTGPRLLEPITVVELAGFEPVLAQLWLAIDNKTLTAAQQHQIVAMAELLKAQQLAARPDETERWKLVGPLRAVLKYLAKEAPRDALAWWKLAELLDKINWSTLADELPL